MHPPGWVGHGDLGAHRSAVAVNRAVAAKTEFQNLGHSLSAPRCVGCVPAEWDSGKALGGQGRGGVRCYAGGLGRRWTTPPLRGPLHGRMYLA